MDIICGKCGMHFSSIESAREHGGHCKSVSNQVPIHLVPSEKSKLSPAEWDALMKALNDKDLTIEATSTVTAEPINLQICPECKKKSLHLNPASNRYECLNHECAESFHRETLERYYMQIGLDKAALEILPKKPIRPPPKIYFPSGNYNWLWYIVFFVVLSLVITVFLNYLQRGTKFFMFGF